jgi:integrase
VIASDPSDGITLPRIRRAELAMALPTAAQVRALLDAAPDRWRAFVALCAFAGLRLGEAAAVQVGDVDFLRRTLSVARQVQGANGGPVEIRPPKYGSERAVCLADGLVEILSAHVAAHCPGTAPDGSCSAPVTLCRRTRTRSAPGGARRARRPGAARSSCTI